MKPNSHPLKRIFLPGVLLIGLVSIALLIVGPTWADDAPRQILLSESPPEVRDEPEAAPTDREMERDAPLRGPVVIEQSVTRDGGIRTVLEIPATADSYIASNRPNTNFGSDALFLGYSAGGFGAERILLHFPVWENVPRDANIVSAKAQLYLSISDPDVDADAPSVLRRLGSSWGEHSVSWNNSPVWSEVADTVYISDDTGLVSWDMSDMTRAWMRHEFPNHGVEIIGDERVQQRERVFFSRETTGNNFPRLRVTYDTNSDGGSDEFDGLVAKVHRLPGITHDPEFFVTWSIDRGNTPLKYFVLRYRYNGGDWVIWQNQVTKTSSGFGTSLDGYYEFEASATNEEGIAEPWDKVEAGILVDARAPFITPRLYLPSVGR